MVLLIEMDSNAILLVEAMIKNRTSTEERWYVRKVLIDAFAQLPHPKAAHILDNKCSSKLIKERIKLNKMMHQLVPRHDLRQNIVEKAIQVFIQGPTS